MAVTKSYAEGSSQTIQIDPDKHLRNYKNLTPASDRKQACAPSIDEHESNVDKSDEQHEDDQSDDDSSSFDQEEELKRRLNPTRSEDFETLQIEVVQWRRREERKIIITARSEEHRQEMKKLLLKKEAHILRTIEQLKNSAADKSKVERIEQMMEMMSQPKQWEVSNGAIIDVDTPETCRAREMKTMYDELNKKVDKVVTRIQLLERIKASVCEMVERCGLAKDVCGLLDRELQMLHNGTDLGPEFMDGMRKRLSNQFTKLVTRLNSESCPAQAPSKVVKKSIGKKLLERKSKDKELSSKNDVYI